MTYIRNLNIKSFRGISSLQLDNLLRINILTGDNNCGKTSVLEVLQSYRNPEDFRVWGGLLRRKYPSPKPLAFSYYDGFYDLFNINNQDKKLEYIIESQNAVIGTQTDHICLLAKVRDEEVSGEEYRKIQGLTYLEQDNEQLAIENSYPLKRMDIQIKINDKIVSEGYIYEGQRRIEDNNILASYKRERNIVYISPSRHTEADVYLTDILKYPELYEEMLGILREYDKDIISINYDNDTRYTGRGIYKILSKSYKEALPLNVYGDGMKKAILLMSAVLKAQNGILLLDEFETAIHTSAMERTFRWILETCLKLNVQVFLTSHSKEAIDKVLKCSENVKSNTSLYTLYKEEDKIAVRRLSGEKAIEVQDEMGLELR